MNGGQDAELSVTNLRVELPTSRGWIAPVDGVSFDVRKGEVLGLVGETGSGKTLTALAIMRLLPAGAKVSGEVRVGGRDILHLPERDMQRVRGRQVSMVFQEPMTSLDPLFTVGEQIAERLRVHTDIDRKSATARAVQLLEWAGLPNAAERIKAYPFQLSGGMRQRAMIAMALALSPTVLIADEPTTALDVTVQAQILELVADLQTKSQLSVLFISHDLAVIAMVSERVAVMYAGEIVEILATDSLFRRPQHPYTQGLVRCLPSVVDDKGYLGVIEGAVPDPHDLPAACRFAPRCPYAIRRCTEHRPPLQEVADGEFLRCWNPQPFKI